MGDKRKAVEVILTSDDLRQLDDWCERYGIAGREAAVTDLVTRGLNAEGFDTAPAARPPSKRRLN